ncbi:unnamed protein product, partial [Porites lobata]
HGGAHEPWLARLKNVRNGHMGYWSADLNKAGQWLQIKLEEETGDKTQHTGKAFLAPPQWVTFAQRIMIATPSCHTF